MRKLQIFIAAVAAALLTTVGFAGTAKAADLEADYTISTEITSGPCASDLDEVCDLTPEVFVAGADLVTAEMTGPSEPILPVNGVWTYGSIPAPCTVPFPRPDPI